MSKAGWRLSSGVAFQRGSTSTGVRVVHAFCSHNHHLHIRLQTLEFDNSIRRHVAYQQIWLHTRVDHTAFLFLTTVRSSHIPHFFVLPQISHVLRASRIPPRDARSPRCYAHRNTAPCLVQIRLVGLVEAVGVLDGTASCCACIHPAASAARVASAPVVVAIRVLAMLATFPAGLAVFAASV